MKAPTIALVFCVAILAQACSLLGDPHSTFADCARMCHAEGLILTGRVHHGQIGVSCVCETPRSVERGAGSPVVSAAARGR